MNFTTRLFACSFLAFWACASPSQGPVGNHIGGCVLRSPARPAPLDSYYVEEIHPTDEYAPFTKQLGVYGITLIGRDDISDRFMEQVAQAIVEMFPRGAGVDPVQQRAILTNMHRYRATIPFFLGEDFDMGSKAAERAWDLTTEENSVCDEARDRLSSDSRPL